MLSRVSESLLRGHRCSSQLHVSRCARHVNVIRPCWYRSRRWFSPLSTAEMLVAGRSGKARLECTSCGAGNVHNLVAPDPSIRPSQHRSRAHHITTGLPRQDESPLGCINHRSSYAGIHCPAPSWVHAPSAYLCEGMVSINHGPWRPCVRARARRGVTCMSPTWMKDTVRHRKSHPASTSEPNTTQTHESALHDGMPIHGCMSCRGQHEGRVGPVASSGKERQAGICNRVRECNLYLWK